MTVRLKCALHDFAILIGVALNCAGPAVPQWLNYPTPGIPRLANGKPNLSAPPQRTREGRPDLSGIWQLEPAPCQPQSVNGCAGDYRGGREFGNMGVNLKDGRSSSAWNGYSVEKWQGDTLVVDTIGLRDGTWLDRNARKTKRTTHTR